MHSSKGNRGQIWLSILSRYACWQRKKEREQSPCNDSTQYFWTVRGHGDAGLLCTGTAQPVVHLCLRLRLRAGFDLWLFARRVAVWRGGSGMVGGGATPLVAGAAAKITFILKSR